MQPKDKCHEKDCENNWVSIPIDLFMSLTGIFSGLGKIQVAEDKAF